MSIPRAFRELFTPSRYKAYFGGRGSAKSHSFAAALVIRASQAPLRVLCAREIQKSIGESVKALIDDKIKAIDEQFRHQYEVVDYPDIDSPYQMHDDYLGCYRCNISGLPLRHDDETVEWGDGEALSVLAAQHQEK